MKREPFDRVVERHGPTVLRVCRAVVGPASADDAWSETFLSAMTAYPQLPPGSNLEAWLVTIAHRKAVDQLRVLARAPVPVPDLPGGSALAHPEGAVDEMALGHTLAQGHSCTTSGPELTAPPGRDHMLDPWPALLRLPLRQRQAVAYHHVAGLPYTEVATILSCSPEAARRAASDGIAALRSIFQQEQA